MKNFACLLIFAVLTLFPAIAQDQGMKFGVKMGPNLSTVTGDLTENYDPRLGYHFGVFSEIPISERFSFKPEILYNSIGFILDSSIVDFQSFGNPNNGEISFKSAQRSNYLSLPLSLKFSFNSRFGLEFGPQVSFLLNSVSKLKSARGFESDTDRTTYSGDFKLEYGPNLGLSYSFGQMVLQARYYHGISDIFKNTIGNLKNYHRAIQLSFGYRFP